MRADAGPQIGFGHLMRSSSLAAILSRDFDCVIACRCDNRADDFASSVIRAAGARRLDPGIAPDSSLQDFNYAFLNSLSADAITVLDNYYYDTDYQHQVRLSSRALACIDDMPDRPFDCDVLFTPSPYSKEDFKFVGDSLFFGGIDWAFLRNEFLRVPRLRNRADINNVAVAMGGSDPLGLTEKMVRTVSRVLPYAGIDIIAGPTALINVDCDSRRRVYRNADAETIVGILDRADLGIFPSSTGSVEAMARRLPLAVGFFADNQMRFYDQGILHGWFKPLGDLRDCELDLVGRLSDIVNSYNPHDVPVLDFAGKREIILDIFNDLWQKKTDINA